jgi:hypothetical protein
VQAASDLTSADNLTIGARVKLRSDNTMASGSKEQSAFTGNSIGSGKSTGIKTKGIGFGGQKINSAYPQDNVHGVDLPNTMGGTLAGGPDNLKHSLTGTSAVQRGPGSAGKAKYNQGD